MKVPLLPELQKQHVQHWHKCLALLPVGLCSSLFETPWRREEVPKKSAVLLVSLLWELLVTGPEFEDPMR